MKIEEWIQENQIECTHEKIIEALTHPSLKSEIPDIKVYEQLETIGDAVLDLLTLEYIYQKYPDATPSQLTRGRSNIVNNRILAKVGERIKLNQFIKTGSHHKIGYRDIANSLEAIFGAIYVDNGLSKCKEFMNRIMIIIIEILEKETDGIDLNAKKTNYIGKLQEIIQKFNKNSLPVYKLIEKTGPDHDAEFKYIVEINYEDNLIHAYGVGKSKKLAKENAAKNIVDKLRL